MDNHRYTELFPTDRVKAMAFDKIAELFYSKNFSASSKSEVELLMFSIYMDEMIESCKRDNGTIDYNICSDYEMGKQLGLPQERVRSLKVKKQARYPVSFCWQDSLLSIKDYVRYDKEIKKIIIPTRDPNFYNEIRNYIENHGGYIEIQRSGNIIQIRPEHYFMLIYEGLGESDKNKCRKELISQLQKLNKENDIPESISSGDTMSLVKELVKIGLKSFVEIKSVEVNSLWTIFKVIFNSL